MLPSQNSKSQNLIEVFDIYPQYKAHGMSFDAEFNADVVEYMIDKGYEDSHIGMIHSHCDLSVFFSGPDMQELNANAKAYPLYLSMITNNLGKYTAKIAKYYRQDGTFTGKKIYKDITGKTIIEEINNPMDNSFVETFDCDVAADPLITSGFPEFDAMVNKIIKEHDDRVAENARKAMYSPYNDYETLWGVARRDNVDLTRGTKNIPKLDQEAKQYNSSFFMNGDDFEEYDPVDYEFTDFDIEAILFEFLTGKSAIEVDEIDLKLASRNVTYNDAKHNYGKFRKFLKTSYYDVSDTTTFKMVVDHAINIMADYDHITINQLRNNFIENQNKNL